MESRQKRETHKSIGGQKCWRTAECDRRDGIQVNNINNVYVQDGRLGDWRRYHRYQRPDEQPRDTTLGETMEITGDANNRYLRINTDDRLDHMEKKRNHTPQQPLRKTTKNQMDGWINGWMCFQDEGVVVDIDS
ncbi:uncharacterized protein isoform X5 [Danio rerio]